MNYLNSLDTYDQVPYDYCRQKEWYARNIANVHAIPHWLDPFPTEYPENNHKRMHEICEIPSRHFSGRKQMHIIDVIFTKQLHAHYGKYEDDDAQYKGQVTQSSDSSTHYGYQKI